MTAIKEQSPDIAIGVDRSLEARENESSSSLPEPGAGDQGMMFGYASDESPELMPMPIMLAHRVARRLAAVRKDGTLPFLRPDGKSQVTVEYDSEGRPRRVHTVLVSTQHDPDIEMGDLAARCAERSWLPPFRPEKRITDSHWSTRPALVIGGRWPIRACRVASHRRHLRGMGRHGGAAASAA